MVSSNTYSFLVFLITIVVQCGCTTVEETIVMLYRDVNFGEESKQVNLAPGHCQSIPEFDNIASSVTTTDCINLFDNSDCTGGYLEVPAGVEPSLLARGFNDVTSSLCRCGKDLGTCDKKPNPKVKVTLFQHFFYLGKAIHMEVTEDGGCEKVPIGFNDRTTSVKTDGGCVRLWEHFECRGKWVDVFTKEPNLFRVNFNDITSSISTCNENV